MSATGAAATVKAPKKAAPLAIHGGEKVRKTPMPARLALGDAEVAMVNRVLEHYRQRQIDPGYQGVFEKRYTDLFVEMMGGGYADAVATGTASLYVALAALDLPKGSEVLVSPITDPGSLARHRAQRPEAAPDGQHARQLQRRPRAVRRAHHP